MKKDIQLIEETTEEDEESNLPAIAQEIGENAIISQIQNEYEIAYKFIKPKIDEWLVRLKIYNNQKRDKDKVGDPLLFTIFQTLLASLYSDRLTVSFLPREEGDVETSENTTALAGFDYDEMNKAIVDFEWDWDTLFFGRGLLLMQEFDRKKMCPLPQIVDPGTFLRDPDAVAPNGDARGFNALRFWGREIALIKWELNDDKNYFNVDDLKTGKELRSLMQKMKQGRRTAQGLSEYTNNEDALKENAQYDLLEWWTHIKGKKFIVTLGNRLTKLVRITSLEDEKWSLISRPLFPIAHDWDGVSIPDLLEDKQRARAILQNLGLESAKHDVQPKYLFAEDRIKNRTDFNQSDYIRVKGDRADGAMVPLNKPVVHTQVSWIMEVLDQSAQRALATPEIQQGVMSQQARTLGELELISAKVDTRYSLAAKIFGWSEKEFWQRWYGRYKSNFKEGIDQKVLRITGVFGPEFRKLKRENIITDNDFDIEIESKTVSEAKRMIDRNAFGNFLGLVMTDPQLNRRYAEKHLAKLNGMTRDQIKVLFPPTIDEMEAERENELIQKGKDPAVSIRQNHQEHIMVHGKLNQDELRDKHIEAHQFAMVMARQYQEYMLNQQQQVQPGQPSGVKMERPVGQPATRQMALQGQGSNVVPENYQV